MGTVENIQKDKTAIRDQIGEEPKNTVFGLWEFTETIRVTELPIIIETRDISSDTVWGGTTWGGGLWDSTYTSNKVIQRVICPNNTFKDFLRDTLLWDTTNSTATFNTTNHQISFTDGEIAMCKIFQNSQNVMSALLKKVGNVSGSLSYHLSADNKAHWESVSLSNSHTFTNAGNVLWLKITSSGSSQIDIENANGLSIPIQVSFDV